MKPRSGDRFKWEDYGATWEVLESEQSWYECICVDEGRDQNWKVGETNRWQLNAREWQYLGNFGKSNNALDFWNKIK